MTDTTCLTPEPSPSGARRAPASAEHTNLPADASVWAAARRSFVEDGLSCPVVAERHGLHKRTVARHANDEDWSSARAAHQAGARRRAAEAGRANELDDPAAALVADLRAERVADLLVHLGGDVLVKTLATLAAEAAAAQRPQETLAWLRAVREVDRVAHRIDRALAGGVHPADAFRTHYFRGMHDSAEHELRMAAGDPPDGPDPDDDPVEG